MTRGQSGAVFAGVALTLTAWAAYLALGFALADGRLLGDWNLFIDWDPGRFVQIYGRDALDGYSVDQRVKHPFLLLFRPPVQALVGLGMTPERASAALSASVGALTVATAYIYIGVFGVRGPARILLTVFYASSATQLFAAAVIESYVLSLFGLALLHLAALLRLGGAEAPGARWAIALYLFGVTATNVVQSGIAEFVIQLRRRGLARAVGATFLFAAGVAALGAVLVLLTQPIDFAFMLDHPRDAARVVLWQAPHASTKGPPQEVAIAFLAYSFVAPLFTAIPIEDGAKTMLDFRNFDYPMHGLAAVALWLALLGVGALLAWRDRNRAALAIVWLCFAFNVAFHMYFQHRQSVFLYAAHSHFLVFAAVLPCAKRIAEGAGAWRAAGLGAMACLAALTLLNNGGRAFQLVDALR